MNKPLHPEQLRNLAPLNGLSPRQLWELRVRIVPLALAPGQLLDLVDELSSKRHYLMSGSLLLTDHDGQPTRLVAGTSAALHSLAAGRLLEARALDDCQLLTVDSKGAVLLRPSCRS